jgi:deoxyadenosine/deoxycytidine kinase
MPTGEKMENRVYVTVCGNIGAGKTSLVERLCKEFNWQPYFEGVVDHPYLDDYYKDMQRWGFHTQIYFLTARLRQQQEIAEIAASVCQDRSIYEDHEIFARSLTSLGIMSQRDYQSYRLLFESITPYISRPDLMIYLRASVPTLTERIYKRSRDCESTITRDYLEHLNKHYDDWMSRFDVCPILTLDGDHLDFVNRPADLRQVYEDVHQMLGFRVQGLGFRVPGPKPAIHTANPAP